MKQIILLTGPGGSGKSTLAARLCERHEFVRHLSVTTAPVERRELAAPEYLHVQDCDFAHMLAAGHFAEHLLFPTGVRYGFPRPEADPRGRILVGITSAEGIAILCPRLAPEWNVVVVLVDAADDDLDRRVMLRRDTPAEAEARRDVRKVQRSTWKMADLVLRASCATAAEESLIEHLRGLGWLDRSVAS